MQQHTGHQAPKDHRDTRARGIDREDDGRAKAIPGPGHVRGDVPAREVDEVELLEHRRAIVAAQG